MPVMKKGPKPSPSVLDSPTERALNWLMSRLGGDPDPTDVLGPLGMAARGMDPLQQLMKRLRSTESGAPTDYLAQVARGLGGSPLPERGSLFQQTFGK
jgi:hypothetical protein